MAIADATLQRSSRCNPGKACEVSIARNKEGQLLVTIATIVPAVDTPVCAQRFGDQDVLVYNSAGQFETQLTSL